MSEQSLSINALRVLAIALAIVPAFQLLNLILEPFFRTKYIVEESDERDNTSPTIVVTLVHGTWGWRSSWLAKGSQLRQALTSLGRPSGSVLFARLAWSGLNSVSGRRRATETLRRGLGEMRLRFPAARHVIVAHSHGGNVACCALEFKPNLVDAIVCMSTPFLIAKFRSYYLSIEKPAESISRIVQVLTRAFCLPVLALCGISYLLGWLSGQHMLFVIGVIATPIVIVILGAFASVYAQFAPLPELDPEALMIVRCAGDEASGAINIGTMTTGIVVRSLDLFTSFIERIPTVPARLLIGMPVIVVLSLVSGYGAMFFGIELLLSGFDYEYYTEPTPPGVHRVFSPSGERWITPGTMRHSIVYESPVHIDAISDWLRARIEYVLAYRART